MLSIIKTPGFPSLAGNDGKVLTLVGGKLVFTTPSTSPGSAGNTAVNLDFGTIVAPSTTAIDCGPIV